MERDINNIISRDTESTQNEINTNNKKNLSNIQNDKSNKEPKQNQTQVKLNSNVEAIKEIPIQERAEFDQLSKDISEKIHFYNSTLTEEDCFLIGEKIKSNKSCTLLSLGNSQLADEALKHICKSIKSNEKLITIGLGNNLIGDKGLIYLGEALKGHKSLTTIGLGNNLICDTGVKFLCEGLKENIVYQDLLLYNNRITSLGCEYLKDLLTWDAVDKSYLGNKQIKKLYLGSNKIRKEGVSFLGEALRVNETLENLGLSHCEIDDVGVISFAESLGSNLNNGLKYLSIGNNQITSASVKPLFKALACCKKIEEVSLEWNALDDNCAEDVNDFLKRSRKSLRKLLLNNNKFSEIGVLKIIKYVLENIKENHTEDSEIERNSLDKLELVVLSNNNVSESVKVEISKMLLESKCTQIKAK